MVGVKMILAYVLAFLFVPATCSVPWKQSKMAFGA